jgi:hypothetical protein
LKWMLNQVIKLHHSFTRVCVNVYYQWAAFHVCLVALAPQVV